MKKIVVAMSGGVDSAVAAALLKKAGFELTGVFMKLADLPRFKESEKRARKIAKILGIPFLVLDLRKEFKKRIVDDFLKEYKRGVTPNPCVICNKEIKFGLLLEKALSLGADFVATGHYVRTNPDWLTNSTIVENVDRKEIKLLRGKDKNKDQSYFLWMLNQEQLKRILFPIGDYTRAKVEKLARKLKLPVLKAKKSVEICFIKTTINDFLSRHLRQKSGKIIDTNGKIIGEHQGLALYTTGQRKGIKLPGGPYYVLDKNFKKNILIVTKNERNLYKKELIARNINWVSGETPKLPLKIKAKIRYRHQLALATVVRRLKFKVYSLKFKVAQRAITPGQSVVFYQGWEVIGGGIIY